MASPAGWAWTWISNRAVEGTVSLRRAFAEDPARYLPEVDEVDPRRPGFWKTCRMRWWVASATTVPSTCPPGVRSGAADAARFQGMERGVRSMNGLRSEDGQEMGDAPRALVVTAPHQLRRRAGREPFRRPHARSRCPLPPASGTDDVDRFDLIGLRWIQLRRRCRGGADPRTTHSTDLYSASRARGVPMIAPATVFRSRCRPDCFRGRSKGETWPDEAARPTVLAPNTQGFRRLDHGRDSRGHAMRLDPGNRGRERGGASALCRPRRRTVHRGCLRGREADRVRTGRPSIRSGPTSTARSIGSRGSATPGSCWDHAPSGAVRMDPGPWTRLSPEMAREPLGLRMFATPCVTPRCDGLIPAGPGETGASWFPWQNASDADTTGRASHRWRGVRSVVRSRWPEGAPSMR